MEPPGVVMTDLRSVQGHVLIPQSERLQMNADAADHPLLSQLFAVVVSMVTAPACR